jgi:hypothetical protein
VPYYSTAFAGGLVLQCCCQKQLLHAAAAGALLLQCSLPEIGGLALPLEPVLLPGHPVAATWTGALFFNAIVQLLLPSTRCCSSCYLTTPLLVPARVLMLFRLVSCYSNAAPRTGAATDSAGTLLLHVMLLHQLEPYSSRAFAWTGASAASSGSLLLQYCCKAICYSSAVARTGTATSASS